MNWMEFIRRLVSVPWRIIIALLATIAAYDALSSQLGLPAISSFMPWKAADITWWGWLLIAQALILLAMADYIRQLPRTTPDTDYIPQLPATTGDTVNGEAEPEGPEPYPDMKFEEVVARISAILNAKSDAGEVGLKDVGHELLDRVKLHHMHAWGRSGETALAMISEYEWESARIEWVKNGLRIPGTMSYYVIEDVHFVRAEVDTIWPAASH